jgi:hypothetical protein
MTLLNFLRKPTFSILLSALVLFASCSQYDTIENTEKNLSVEQLSNIHNQLKNEFSSSKLFSKKTSTNQEFLDVFEAEYDKNLEIAKNNGVEALFEIQGLDTSLPTTVTWAINNLDNPNFYEELLEREEITSVDDAQILFSYILTTIDVQNDTNTLGKSTFMKSQGDCAWAVASTIVATAIFAGVVIGTGGVGLAAAVGFFATKTWLTIGISRAC